MVIFIDAFWCSLCFASMIVVYYVSIEASFIATFYPTIWRIFHIHHASINTAIGHSWSYFIWSYALRKCLKNARYAWYSATYMECKQPTEKRFWQMCYNYTSSASACGICVKTYSYAYTLCVVSRILAIG